MSPSKPNIPKEKSPVSKPKAKQLKTEKQPKNRPVIDRKASKSKKTEIYNRGAVDSKKSAKIINKNAVESKQIKPDASKDHIEETENQENLDPEEVELRSRLESKNNESVRKENFDPIGQNINDDMHSTFLHNNEQIIADLANLEIEQEKQIFQIVYDTFNNDHGLTDLENLNILGKALGHEEKEIEDLCKQINENFDGMMDFEQFCEMLPKLDSVFTPKDIHKQDQEASKTHRPEEEKKLDEIIEKKQDDTTDIQKNQDLEKEEYDEELDKINQREPKLTDYKDNAIVPSNGVALTPDSRIVKLIKQLNNYFRNCEKNKQFGEAKVVKYKLERLKK